MLNRTANVASNTVASRVARVDQLEIRLHFQAKESRRSTANRDRRSAYDCAPLPAMALSAVSDAVSLDDVVVYAEPTCLSGSITSVGPRLCGFGRHTQPTGLQLRHVGLQEDPIHAAAGYSSAPRTTCANSTATVPSSSATTRDRPPDPTTTQIRASFRASAGGAGFITGAQVALPASRTRELQAAATQDGRYR